MVVRLSGTFDYNTQAALREGLEWVNGPVVIDVKDAWLTAAALGEIMLLAKRIGIADITLANPSPIMRRVLTLTHCDQLFRIISYVEASGSYLQSA